MNNERLGMFTSSKIHMLTINGRTKDSYGKPFYTYVEEKAMEVILNRKLENETEAYPTAWGKLVEQFAFHTLPIDQSFNIKRYTHLNLPWSGVPDSISAKHVGDIKCPYTLKSAFLMAMLKTGEELKKQKPEYYWQLVSNAILCNRTKAELDIFVPKITRLNEIVEKAIETESLIRFKTAEGLPLLPANCDFPELTRIAFEIPEKDMLFLESRIIEASDERNAKIDEYKEIFKREETVS